MYLMKGPLKYIDEFFTENLQATLFQCSTFYCFNCIYQSWLRRVNKTSTYPCSNLNVANVLIRQLEHN